MLVKQVKAYNDVWLLLGTESGQNLCTRCVKDGVRTTRKKQNRLGEMEEGQENGFTYLCRPGSSALSRALTVHCSAISLLPLLDTPNLPLNTEGESQR